MKKLLIILPILFLFGFSDDKVYKFSFKSLKLSISINDPEIILKDNLKDDKHIFAHFTGPTVESPEGLINPSYGIIIEKVPNDADPILYYINTLINVFNNYGENKIPKFSNKDKFMKLPNSCGTEFDIKYPDGVIHTIFVIVSVYKGYGIKIIGDTTKKTYSKMKPIFIDRLKTIEVDVK